MEEIKFSPDSEEKFERAVEQAKKHGAACFWCGHGYEDYSRKSEAEHIAYHCPDAPEKLKEDMRRTLSERHADIPNACADKKATSKRPCRRRRS
jgi:hypothetical protein